MHWGGNVEGVMCRHSHPEFNVVILLILSFHIYLAAVVIIRPTQMDSTGPTMKLCMAMACNLHRTVMMVQEL